MTMEKYLISVWSCAIFEYSHVLFMPLNSHKSQSERQTFFHSTFIEHLLSACVVLCVVQRKVSKYDGENQYMQRIII